MGTNPKTTIDAHIHTHKHTQKKKRKGNPNNTKVRDQITGEELKFSELTAFVVFQIL